MPIVLSQTNSYIVNHGYPDIHHIFYGYKLVMSNDTPQDTQM